MSPCKGLSLKRTPGGVPVIRLHYSADSDLTPQKLSEIRARYSSDAYWRREMEIEHDALSGALVYPEYDENIHVIPDKDIPKRGCRFVSVDPHPRTPHAILWLLIDAWSDWYIYRELWPSVMYGLPGKMHDDREENIYTVREYSECMAYLEGNRIEWRNAETDNEYGLYRTSASGEKICFRLCDQAGKGFRASGEGEQLESYSTRYSRYGIDFADPKKSHQAGEDAIHQLLKSRNKDARGNWPKLHIAESCRELRLELKSHRYQITRTPSEEKDLKQDRAQSRCHQVDNLRYLATSDAYYSRSQESTAAA